MKSKNKQKRLQGRVKDYVDMMNQGAMWYAGRSGPAKRADTNGYRKPGSNNK